MQVEGLKTGGRDRRIRVFWRGRGGGVEGGCETEHHKAGRPWTLLLRWFDAHPCLAGESVTEPCR